MTLRPTCRISAVPGRQRLRPPRRAAFSLVELVIVVVIVGIVSSIAVPRFSRAAKSATANSLRATLSSVRRSIDLYAAEHGPYPGYDTGGTPDGGWFVKQLIEYSAQGGKTSASFSSAYLYGPYLRGPFPPNPFNELNTVTVKATPAAADPAVDSCGWIGVLSTGDFYINTADAKLTELDIAAGEIDRVFKRGG